ncbi:hypothetical protein [Vibrio sp. D431a]|uniref:hypothetical protein n=1 Tax=Vibrio sp. D431a TaxID=2837388 RepID=UPI0025548865|nr:hypothetical protein [Vibrio sp. D431a]MDK9790663.1 hypothetical protein [Vibrio sp. D431a]
MADKESKIWGVRVKTESGDESVHGYWSQKPTDDQIAKVLIKELESEIKYWVEDEGKDMNWAALNPSEAIEIACLYPVLFSLESKD